MKKGFTLIELLAVIVILAIIALIATPIILNIINDAREESNKRSVDMYASAVKTALLLHEMNGTGEAVGTFTALDAYTLKNEEGVTLTLNYNGNEVMCDIIQVYSTGELFLSKCKVNGKLVDYEYGTMTLGNHIISNYGGESKITTVSDFTQISSGLYKAEDDIGISYYFRGNVENNYLIFGKELKGEIIGKICPYGDCESNINYDTLEACVADIANGAPWSESDCINTSKAGEYYDIYWRIVRVNGDGTIRLVYDGSEKKENGSSHVATISSSYYNNTSGSYNNFERYGNSIVQTVLDNWYDMNLKQKYNEYISDSIFCNDTTGTYKYWDSMTGEETETGDMLDISFLAGKRISSNTPSIRCENKSDRYTVKDEESGNAMLSNPISMLTSDEVILSLPGVSSYLYSGEHYWTISPNYSDIWGSSVFFVGTNGLLSSDWIDTDSTNVEHGVRPVINLKADVKFTGTGTIDDPYVIITE